MTRSGDERAATASQPCRKDVTVGTISALEKAYEGYRCTIPSEWTNRFALVQKENGQTMHAYLHGNCIIWVKTEVPGVISGTGEGA